MSSSQQHKRVLTNDRILQKLPAKNFKYGKDEKEKKPENAQGMDLSNLLIYRLEDDCLSTFPKLTRLVLKSNELETLPILPSTLKYLDVSKNQRLTNLSFLKGLVNLTSLLLSECVQLQTSFRFEEDFVDCKNLKVLLLDHIGIAGKLILNEKIPFRRTLSTLIVSHNALEEIDLKSAKYLDKLSASNNPKLSLIMNIPRTLTELRLAHCVGLSSLDFLNKNLKNLELLDLAKCPLVSNWKNLEISSKSLLNLNLKGTNLRIKYDDNLDKYQKDCLKNLKCKKLRSLDFTTIPSAIYEAFKNMEQEEEDDDDNDEGEDFPEIQKPELSMHLEDFQDCDTKEVMPKQKKGRVDDADDLFLGEKSAW